MAKCIRQNYACLPGWWVNVTQNHPVLVVAAYILITFLVLYFIVSNFEINTDMTDMISEELDFRRLDKEFSEAFSQLSRNIVVVIESTTPEQTLKVQTMLANTLKKRTDIFETVYVPGGGEFFEKNGLLFLKTAKLEDLSDSLANAQAFLALLARDLSLTGVFSSLEEIIDNLLDKPEDLKSNKPKFIYAIKDIEKSLKSIMEGGGYKMSWQEMVRGNKDGIRRFVIARPIMDYNKLYPAKNAIKAIKAFSNTPGIKDEEGLSIRMTGGVVLDHDNLVSVQKGIGFSTALSLFLVAVILSIGLRSARLVFASLVTLVVGLIWTMGFAFLAIGSLNMISVAFAVLFIGLGIDYCIQFTLKYRELVEEGYPHTDAMKYTMKEVGNAFILCTLTTAIGFYAFVPTAYTGASELGLISGTGMFINFITNLTLLPAILALFPLKAEKTKSLPLNEKLVDLPLKYSRTIVAVSVSLALLCLFFVPRVVFDYNPMNLADSEAESVITAKELFQGQRTSPWTISIIADDYKEAKELTKKLKKLSVVKDVITFTDFVPSNQNEKLDIISDMALFVPEVGAYNREQAIDYDKTLKAIDDLRTRLLTAAQKTTDDLISPLSSLYRTLSNFKNFLALQTEGLTHLKRLEVSIVENLSIVLNTLASSVEAAPVDSAKLPDELKNRYIASDGRYRVQVFPHKNISEINALKEFVSAVRTVTTEAIDAPVTILESGAAIVQAFRGALIIAVIVITVLLILLLRDTVDVVLILIPLFIAMMWTGTATVLLGISFNFANIIVIPLLLGIGVDYGVHLIHRYRSEPDEAMLRTCTARAVLFSAMTTIVSFGSLSFSTHKGTASMGILLTICNTFIIICTLIILPAFLKALHLLRDYKRNLNNTGSL